MKLSRTSSSKVHTALPHLPLSRLSRPLVSGVVLAGLSLVLLLVGAQFADRHTAFVLGSNADERFLAGFHAVEQNDNVAYRWSNPLAAVFLYGFDGRPAHVTLRLTSPRPPDAPPPTLTLQTQGRTLGTFAIATERNWRRYQVLMPTNPTSDTALRLESNAFQPGFPDTRQLGVALSRVEASATGSAGLLATPQRWLFLGTFPLLVWLALWRIGVSMPTAMGIGVLLAGIAGWIAAFPFTFSYIVPTFGWPWWPFLPLIVLVFAPQCVKMFQTGWAWAQLRLSFPVWTGVLIAALAAVALRLNINVALGMALLLIGAGIAVAGLTRPVTAQRSATSPWPLDVRTEAAVLCVITLVALGLRLYHLDMLPLGLWRDEARHGLLAWRIWHDPTFRPIYVVAGADLPALYFYLTAPIVGIFGPHLWSVRLVSALAGGLMPLALWWAARPLIGARAALLGAALLAWASWGLSMSRWGFPATLDHLLMLTAIGLMWRALPRTTDDGRWTMVLLGLAALCAGLAAYAYHTGRLGPITLAVLTALRLGASWERWRRAMPALLVAAVVGLLTLAPLLSFIASDLEGYNRRVANVSVFDANNLEIHAPALLLLRNVERYLLMWHEQGELNGRHHAPDAPMLDPATGMLFVIGLGLALVWRRRLAYQAVLLLLVLNLIPGLFSGGAPHAMRSLGTLAPACMLAGLALTQIWRNADLQGQRHAVAVLLSVALGGSLVFNTWLYFGHMAHNPAVYNEFNMSETAMARVARLPFDTNDPALQDVQVFVPSGVRRSETVRYLTRDINVGSFDGVSLSDPPGTQALILLPSRAAPELQAAALAALGPDAQPIADVPYDPQGERPLFQAFGTGAAAERLLREAYR